MRSTGSIWKKNIIMKKTEQNIHRQWIKVRNQAIIMSDIKNSCINNIWAMRFFFVVFCFRIVSLWFWLWSRVDCTWCNVMWFAFKFMELKYTQTCYKFLSCLMLCYWVYRSVFRCVRMRLLSTKTKTTTWTDATVWESEAIEYKPTNVQHS